MDVPVIAYRPVTSDDRSWLWDLKRATMRGYVAAIYGWEEEVQRRMFEERFEPERLRIIRVEGRDVGMLEFEEGKTDFFLRRIELLPGAQNGGIGSAVIGGLIDAAAARKKGIRLQVLRSNPARRLYERLGFRVDAETPTHFKMRKEILSTLLPH